MALVLVNGPYKDSSLTKGKYHSQSPAVSRLVNTYCVLNSLVGLSPTYLSIVVLSNNYAALHAASSYPGAQLYVRSLSNHHVQ
jgi:hypothetical protein